MSTATKCICAGFLLLLFLLQICEYRIVCILLIARQKTLTQSLVLSIYDDECTVYVYASFFIHFIRSATDWIEKEPITNENLISFSNALTVPSSAFVCVKIIFSIKWQCELIQIVFHRSQRSLYASGKLCWHAIKCVDMCPWKYIKHTLNVQTPPYAVTNKCQFQFDRSSVYIRDMCDSLIRG